MQVLKPLADDLLDRVRTRLPVITTLWGVNPRVLVEIATALFALGAHYGPHHDSETTAWERRCSRLMDSINGDEDGEPYPLAVPLPAVEELVHALAQLDTVHTGPRLRECLALLAVRHDQPARLDAYDTSGARRLLLETLSPLTEFHYFEEVTNGAGLVVRSPSRWAILAKALLVLFLLDVADDPDSVSREENAHFAEVCGPCGCATRQVYAAFECANEGRLERRNAAWFEVVVESVARPDATDRPQGGQAAA